MSTETVATITAISSRLGRVATFIAVACEVRTTAVITSAWIMMVQALIAAATRSWRSMKSYSPNIGTAPHVHGPVPQ
jgi:hypothetical protein